MKKFWAYRAATAGSAITAVAVAAGAANKFAVSIPTILHLLGL
jgi:hypothetical protein